MRPHHIVGVTIMVLALTACATTKPPPPIAIVQCLPMATYSKADQSKAADEIEKLPQGAQLSAMIRDYGTLRAANRAACGAGK